MTTPDGIGDRPPAMVERVAIRPIAVGILVLPPAIGLAALTVLARPYATVDEWAATGAIPLITLYVLARMFAALAEPLTQEDAARAHTLRRRLPVVVRTMIDVQAYALVFAVVGLASAALYALAGMPWAWPATLKLSGVLIGTAGVACTLCAFALMAIESHASGGIVGRCHSMLILFCDRIVHISGVLNGEFVRHTALRSAH